MKVKGRRRVGDHEVHLKHGVVLEVVVDEVHHVVDHLKREVRVVRMLR